MKFDTVSEGLTQAAVLTVNYAGQCMNFHTINFNKNVRILQKQFCLQFPMYENPYHEEKQKTYPMPNLVDIQLNVQLNENQSN